MAYRESAFALPIRIKYQPPQGLFVYLTVIHSVSLLCLYPPAVPYWSKCVLAVLILFSYGVYLRKYHYARGHPVEVILLPDGGWRLVIPVRQEPQIYNMDLLPGAFVHPVLVILTLRGDPGRFSFIFTMGNVEGATLRRLRVRLRYPI